VTARSTSSTGDGPNTLSGLVVKNGQLIVSDAIMIRTVAHGEFPAPLHVTADGDVYLATQGRGVIELKYTR
jgi:hypothetical protein